MIIIPLIVEPTPKDKVKLLYRNNLEGTTVTVTSENASFPKYRLYDRDIGMYFKGTTTPANFYILVDQPEMYEVDRLIIPAGHNLNGLLLKLQYSIDNFAADINDAISWTQVGSGQIDKSFSTLIKRYWRLNIASPGSPPELTELFLGKTYTFDRNPNWGFETGPQKNIERSESKGGEVQKVKWGEERKTLHYELTKITDDQRNALILFDQECEGIKNFYIQDIEANMFFAELPDGLPKFRAEMEGRWGLVFDVTEALP